MKWYNTKEKLPTTEFTKNKVLLVYKVGNCSPDIAWFIDDEEYPYFCIADDVKQTYEPDFWCEINLPN